MITLLVALMFFSGEFYGLRYYTDGSSDLTDAEFDEFVYQLRKENPDSELLKKTGWGYSITKDTTPGKKYLHRYGEAGSLEKCRTWDEIHPEYKCNPIDISAKLDGLSVVLYYKDGVLDQALTRGDGRVGIDITDKIKAILGDSIPDKAFTGGVRGEILITNDNFKEFQNLHTEAKNPRAIPHKDCASDAPSDFSSNETKSAVNTLCIHEHFCEI